MCLKGVSATIQHGRAIQHIDPDIINGQLQMKNIIVNYKSYITVNPQYDVLVSLE